MAPLFMVEDFCRESVFADNWRINPLIISVLGRLVSVTFAPGDFTCIDPRPSGEQLEDRIQQKGARFVREKIPLHYS